MKPTDFPEANLKLTAPASMPDCLPLSVHRYPPTMRPAPRRPVTAEDFLPGDGPVPPAPIEATREPGGYISRWEPTQEERAAIAAGGPVWVYVVGDGAPPPIAVSGVSPFGAATERAARTLSRNPTVIPLEAEAGGFVHLAEATVDGGATRTLLGVFSREQGGVFAALTSREAAVVAGELLRRSHPPDEWPGAQAGVAP